MKIAKLSLISLTALLSSMMVQSQTVDEIVSKHIDAEGGKDKLAQVNSLYEETSVSVMGNDNPSTIQILNGKGFRSEIEFNGQKIIQCYTDKGGWVINPMQGATDATAMPDDQYKGGRDQISFGGPLLNYQAKGYKVELQGKENVGTASAYKINVTDTSKVETTLFIDAGNYNLLQLVRKANFNGQDINIVITYSDYKKTDFGVTIPYTIETNFGDQFSLTSTVKKAEFNKAIDPKIFEMPK
jgi:hypothetical protein